jgi:hypothetical protein
MNNNAVKNEYMEKRDPLNDLVIKYSFKANGSALIIAVTMYAQLFINEMSIRFELVAPICFFVLGFLSVGLFCVIDGFMDLYREIVRGFVKKEKGHIEFFRSTFEKMDEKIVFKRNFQGWLASHANVICENSLALLPISYLFFLFGLVSTMIIIARDVF